MNFFSYKDGMLSAEDVALDHLAEQVGTPFYCYSSATLARHYKVFADALPKDSLVAFSVKANGNLARAEDPGEAGRGRRCGVGRRTEEGAGRGHPRRQDRFFRRRQDRATKCAWRSTKASTSSMSKASRSWKR